MNISVEGNACVRMTEQLAESLWIEAVFNAYSSISMADKMKINVSDTTDFQNCLEAILHSSRFGRFASSGDDVKIITFSLCFQNCKHKVGNRNNANRTFTFWRANNNFRFAVLIYSLDSSLHRNSTILKINIASLQTAKFSDTKSGKKTQ